MNIRTVAKAAGVSKTTVSHVISGRRPVAAATKRNVLKVMEELGFAPNFFAQALNSNRSHTVALIAQDITNPFYPTLARGVQRSVGAEGYAVLLFDAGAGAEITDAFVKSAIQRRVDGVVVAVSDVEDGLLALQRAGIAVVGVGAGRPGPPMDWVSADDERLARDAVLHLNRIGHARIATISGPPSMAPGTGRLRGYLTAMAELGLVVGPGLRPAGDWTRAGGARAMAELLALDERPTAVFCANDLMAVGALDAVHAHGLRVPNDLALVGVDDIEASSLVRPSLTTVRIPALEIGHAAGDLLLHRITKGTGSAYRHITVQHSLVIRESG